MSKVIPGSPPRARGDQHLTVGLSAILTSYEQATGKAAQARIIVDQEGPTPEVWIGGFFIVSSAAYRPSQ